MRSHKHRPPAERNTGTAPFVGVCPTCGKKRYASKKDAKTAARRVHHDSGMNAYRCGDWWHLGHLPAVVKAGLVGRDEIRRPA